MTKSIKMKTYYSKYSIKLNFVLQFLICCQLGSFILLRISLKVELNCFFVSILHSKFLVFKDDLKIVLFYFACSFLLKESIF